MRYKRLSGFVGARIAPSLRTEFERVAADKKMSLSELAREYIIRGLKLDGVKC
jgi:hypothetical protein